MEASFHFKKVDVLCGDVQTSSLLELKSCALKELKPAGRATLFGLNPKGRRVFLFHQIKGLMSSKAQSWWLERELLIRQGLADSGQHDRSMMLWRRFCPTSSSTGISRRENAALAALFRWKKYVSFEERDVRQRFDSMSLESKKSWIQASQNPLWISAERAVNVPELVSSPKEKYDHVLLYRPSADLLSLARDRIKPGGHFWCWSWQCPTEDWSKVEDECRSPFTPWLWHRELSLVSDSSLSL